MHDELVFIDPADALDPGTTSTGRCGHDAQPMEVAPIPDPGAIAESTARGQLATLGGLPLQVATEPGFACQKERLDGRFRSGPSAPRGEWDRHHDATLRVDQHPQTAGPRRATEGVVDGTARQVSSGHRFGDRHQGSVTQ
jgi:hypothetical protein